jgi:hypothetical protein
MGKPSGKTVEHLDQALAELSIWWCHEVECDDSGALHVPASLLEEAGSVWARNSAPTDGYPDGKYPDLQIGPHRVPNFKGGIRVSRLIDSALRHLIQLAQGVSHDPESGLHHAGHAVCNLSMAAFMVRHRPDCDDRDAQPLAEAFGMGSGEAATATGEFFFFFPPLRSALSRAADAEGKTSFRDCRSFF